MIRDNIKSVAVRSMTPSAMELPSGAMAFDAAFNDSQPIYRQLRDRDPDLSYLGSDINANMIEHCRSKHPEEITPTI